jgi:hypothetical protein
LRPFFGHIKTTVAGEPGEDNIFEFKDRRSAPGTHVTQSILLSPTPTYSGF